MLRRAVLTLALVLTLAAVVVPIAAADPCCKPNGNHCDGTGGNGNGNGSGNGNQCQAAPEAPDALLFPLVAIAVIGGYVLLTRRRRPADQ